MRLHGLESVVVEPHHPYEIGPFVVRFVPSRHSKLILGRRVPFDGPLTCEDLHGLSPNAYKCGDVFGIRIEVAGTSLYHQGSADLDDAQPIEGVDVFLAGITGRQVTPRYWERILPRLDPRLLVPTHYDDFFAPLDRPLKLVRRVGIEGLPDEIHAVSRDAALAAVPRAPARPPATPGS
jgi:L-ascorbate metabolism protein UlaG (beta-lactamase superfamily)